jgi:hypothetical protein
MAHERVTVNLTQKSSEALAVAVELTDGSTTDTFNKALQLYGLLQSVQANGGAIYIRETGDGELERLRVP